MNYHDFTVDELRSAARSKGLKGAKVVFMKKDELIYFLETGAIIETGEKYFNSKIIAGIDKKELKETFDGGSIFYGALLRGKYIKEVFDGENWVTLNN